MLKDIEGLSRKIIGFSKISKIDGKNIKIAYKLKPLDLNWLRKMFNVDSNHSEMSARHMCEEKGQNYKLNKEQYEALKPYMIGEPVDFNEYKFFLDSGGASMKEWDWSAGYPPIQIKNAINKINPLIKDIEQIKEYYKQNPSLLKSRTAQLPSPILLETKSWEEFYEFRFDNYPFTEFSSYRIDWDNVKNYKRVSWNRAIVAPKHVREFLENTCLNKFKEVAIAYGPKEPTILVSLEYICDSFLETFFEDTWGACFIIGAKRNKYGIVTLINECFVEVACGEYLTAPDL